MRYIMKKILACLAATTLLFSCDLDEIPVSEVSKGPVFSTENGLELYANSFYDILPTPSAAHQGDNMCDYAARALVPAFILQDNYGPQQSDGWEWEKLRNVNYFIQHCADERVPEATRLNYIGLARFFRAWFYFDKVKRFGDVPWINKAMEVDDPDLYAGRDARTLVMDSVRADLDFAAEHISLANDPTCSLVTKYVALAFKSRVCLFEGTFRKYHTEYNLQQSAAEWLNEAARAAEEVMNHSGYKLYTSAGDEKSYRDLFISQKPVAAEVMLAAVCDQSLSVLNDANWYWTSATYGPRLNLIRTFVNTYLMTDGTPFTDRKGYETLVFTEEVKHRDKRLQQTIRTPGYKRIDGGAETPAPAVFSYTYTGYQPIKYCLDDVFYDSGANNDNSIPLIRYAEVLLNYAEAKAELGTLSDTDWAHTIGALRSRAGITGGLDAKPTRADGYLQAHYFPEIADPALLEIRRERGIELVFEGFRFSDLLRWKKGELMTMPWNGFYVPELDRLIDLNEDGTPDVCFTMNENVENPVSGVTYVVVSETKAGKVNPQRLSGNTKGELTWLNNIPRVWEGKHYLYPIPEMDIIMNPNLKQNPGW